MSAPSASGGSSEDVTPIDGRYHPARASAEVQVRGSTTSKRSATPLEEEREGEDPSTARALGLALLSGAGPATRSPGVSPGAAEPEVGDRSHLSSTCRRAVRSRVAAARHRGVVDRIEPTGAGGPPGGRGRGLRPARRAGPAIPSSRAPRGSQFLASPRARRRPTSCAQDRVRRLLPDGAGGGARQAPGVPAHRHGMRHGLLRRHDDPRRRQPRLRGGAWRRTATPPPTGQHVDALSVIRHHNWVWQNLIHPRMQVKVEPAASLVARIEGQS